jgi:hypothetical protein
MMEFHPQNRPKQAKIQQQNGWEGKGSTVVSEEEKHATLIEDVAVEGICMLISVLFVLCDFVIN